MQLGKSVFSHSKHNLPGDSYRNAYDKHKNTPDVFPKSLFGFVSQKVQFKNFI